MSLQVGLIENFLWWHAVPNYDDNILILSEKQLYLMTKFIHEDLGEDKRRANYHFRICQQTGLWRLQKIWKIKIICEIQQLIGRTTVYPHDNKETNAQGGCHFRNL